MDLKIKIDKRSKGKFYQKARFGQSKCKEVAIKDISEYCEDLSILKYFYYESIILLYSKYPEQIVYLDTTIY
jgi:hypothetical protein